jgi:hypothetical protein
VLLSLSVLLVGASCGGGSSPPTPVASLSDSEATALCQQFFTEACAAGLGAKAEPACSGCDPCHQATSLATIRSTCGDGITDVAVRHCMSTHFDMPTCTGPERGGCMFDVGDALCPVTSTF